MKKILLASAVALLVSSNAFAQAARTATQTGAQAFGAQAPAAGRTVAPTAGRAAAPRTTTAPRTGRTERTVETAAPRARTTVNGAGLNATAATTAAGVSVSGQRTAAPVVAPSAGIAAPSCSAAIQSSRTLPFQAAMRSAKKFGGATCAEVISPAGQAVAINLINAVEAAPAANDAAELTAAQRQIEAARPGISPAVARADAAKVMCNTTGHEACVRALPSTGICQLAQREGLLN